MIKNTDMDKMYLVKIAEGQYDDYHENNIFVTADREVAELWVDRFNGLVDRVKKKLSFVGPFEDAPNCFWGDYVYWDNPCAEIQEIDVRPELPNKVRA